MMLMRVSHHLLRGRRLPQGSSERFWGRRFLSSSEEASPLFLWLGQDGVSEEALASKLLLPVQEAPLTPTVTSVEAVVELVNGRYGDGSDQFVGGMGESDPGVWFATVPDDPYDTLHYWELIQESIARVKEERHGIPFGLTTSGCLPADLQQALPQPLKELGVKTIEVSLHAANPPDYAKATGNTTAAFGQVCSFIVQHAEEGMAVHVGVQKQYSAGASDLILSLGALQVQVYPDTA